MFSFSRRRSSFVIVLVIFTLALAGCGSRAAKFASTAPTTTTSGASASTPPSSSSSSTTPSANPPASSPSSPPSSPSPSPAPAPAPAPPSPAPASPVTQYVYTADAGTNTISAFKINSDGSLTGTSGGGTSSPFIVRGAATDTLLVGNTQLQAFTVDPSTGAIHSSQTLTPGPADLAVDSTGEFAYQININPCQAGSCRDLSAYRVLNGTLQSIAGMAVKEGGTGPYTGAPVNPLFEAVDPAGRYLFIAGSPGPGPTPGVEFRAITRNSDGTLGSVSPRQRDLCSNIARMAAASNGKLSFVYNSCGKDNMIQWTVFDSGSGNVVSSGHALTAGTPQPLALDSAGKFLVAGDTTGNSVEVYSIDPATGTITQTQQIAAGNHPSSITFDSTGQFVYVTNWGSNDLTAYRFNNGTLQAIGTYKTGQGPESITIVKP